MAVVIVTIWALNEGNTGVESLLRLVDLGGGHHGLASAAAALLIGAGIASALVAVVGCFGAMKENKALLYTYAAGCSLLLIMLAAGAVMASSKDMAEVLAKPLHRTLVSYNPGSPLPEDTAAVAAWDAVQRDVSN